jgi:CRISPR-associated protein Cas1
MPKDNHHVFADGDLSRSEDTLRIDTLDGETKHLPVESIGTLYLHGQITFNTRALGLLNEHGVPVHVFGWKDYYRGSYLPKRGHLSGNTVVEQVRAYDDHDRRLTIARSIIQASIHNMRANLVYYDARDRPFADALDRLAELKNEAGECSDIDTLRGVEATARKTYYACFDDILREPFTLGRREYNPPTNETNALISFLNAMVYTACVSAIRKTALDPTIGFMHEPGDRRFTLSLDIADIYKPRSSRYIVTPIPLADQTSANDGRGVSPGLPSTA